MDLEADAFNFTADVQVAGELANLARMGAIAMELMEAVHARALAPGAPPLIGGDAPKHTHPVYLIEVLQRMARRDMAQAARFREIERKRMLGGTAPSAKASEAPRWPEKERIREAVTVAIERAEPAEREDLLVDMRERLDDLDIGSALQRRPIGLIAAQMCRDLKIEPYLCKFTDAEIGFVYVKPPRQPGSHLDRVLGEIRAKNIAARRAAGEIIPDSPDG